MNRSPVPPFAIETGALISPRLCGRPLTNQRQVHQGNGIDATENVTDPFLAFVEGIAAVGESLRVHRPGFSAVITGQDVAISKRHPADAPTLTHGLVTALDEGPRGVTFATQIVLTDEAGEPFAEMTTNMLLINLALHSSEKTVARAPTPAPSPGEASDTVEIGRHTFTPAAARAFEEGWPPSLHADPEQARAAGFAKPIIAGNQVFSILWKRFIEPSHPLPVSMNFALKRPIFWDEEVTVARTLDQVTEPETIEVRNSAGKTAIVCKVFSAQTGSA